MARLWMSGAEAGHVGVLPAVVQSGTGALTVSASFPRSGAYSFRMRQTSAGSYDQAYASVNLQANKTEIYARIALRVEDAVNNSLGIIQLLDDLGTVHLTLCLNSAMQLQLRRGSSSGTILATGSALSINQYYVIEFRATIADAGGVAVVRLDTVIDINFSGATRNAGNANIRSISFGGLKTSDGFPLASWDLYTDDVAINDTAGAQNNSWPGNSGIYALIPDGAGNYTNIATLVGAPTHWQAEDDIPPDEDTSYVEDATIGNEDTYTMTALPVSGTISAVQWLARAKLDAAGAGSIRRLYRIGGVDYAGSDLALTTGYAYYRDLLELSPASGIAWTEAELNALEAGVQVR